MLRCRLPAETVTGAARTSHTALRLVAQDHVDSLHDVVLVGVVGVVLGGDLQQRGNHLLVVPNQVPDVVSDLLI